MIHGDVLGERARISPEATALVELRTRRRFSYRELDARATACAHFLSEELSLGVGDRFSILSQNRVEFVDLLFGAAKSGSILVPLNTRLAERELEGILSDSGAGVLFFDAPHLQAALALAEKHPELVLVGFDGQRPGVSFDYAESLALNSGLLFHRVQLPPEHPQCLLYTSGTTGKPKGVIIPQRMLAWNGFATAAAWQLSEEDVSPIFTPLYHAGGLGAFLLPILTVGGRIILHEAFDAGEVWDVIEKEKCTVVLGVPTIWNMLAEHPSFESSDLGAVRWFISGGAPLPRHLIETYHRRGIVLRQGYGMTEVGVNCFTMSSEDALRKQGSIGRPMLYLEARVVDEENNVRCPGEVGELCFRGPALSLGYWNQPEVTAASRDGEGFFHTGDMVRVDEEGFFYIAGRAKDMFISGGVNVYPAEIENELLRHPELEDAAVVGIPDPKWGELGVGFVVPRPGRDLSGDALSEFLSDRLAKFKIPRKWVFLKELPRTSYGKVIKAELRKVFEASLAGGNSEERDKS